MQAAWKVKSRTNATREPERRLHLPLLPGSGEHVGLLVVDQGRDRMFRLLHDRVPSSGLEVCPFVDIVPGRVVETSQGHGTRVAREIVVDDEETVAFEPGASHEPTDRVIETDRVANANNLSLLIVQKGASKHRLRGSRRLSVVPGMHRWTPALRRKPRHGHQRSYSAACKSQA